MSDEPDTPDEGEDEEGDEVQVPPSGYIPGAPPIAGQNVGDRGEVITHLPEGGEHVAGGPEPEEVP